jgi:hypothetical protein
VVTLVNLNPTEARTVIVQGGAYAEHQLVSAEWEGKLQPLHAADITVTLAPGSGVKLALTMKRYAHAPTITFPWDRP